MNNNFDYQSATYISSSVTGFIIGGLTTPLDALKTKVQLLPNFVKVRGISDGLYTLYKEEGLNRIFSGFYSRTIRCALGAGIWVSVYESFIKF